MMLWSTLQFMLHVATLPRKLKRDADIADSSKRSGIKSRGQSYVCEDMRHVIERYEPIPGWKHLSPSSLSSNEDKLLDQLTNAPTTVTSTTQ